MFLTIWLLLLLTSLSECLLKKVYVYFEESDNLRGGQEEINFLYGLL